MTDEVSIWRWQVEDDLEALFARLVTADADGFNQIAAQMAGNVGPDLQDTQAETEDKIRAMGLPADVLETTLEGFRAMVAEAEEERAALEAEIEGDSEGRIGAALASSHMFYDDPYASLSYQEIDRQVDVAVQTYRTAIGKAVGDDGQSFANYLGVAAEQLGEDTVFDALMTAGFDGAVWVWANADVAFVLSQWQEDKELPIDLELHRVPTKVLAALKTQL